MTAPIRFRDALASIVPWWLSARLQAGLTVGYRYLWGIVQVLDGLAEFLVQGIQAAWPGIGTPTALALIGRSRGIVRGLDDTNDEYAARLRVWLDTWRNAGSQQELARQIRAYLRGRPRVRIVTRAGLWFTIEADGTESTAQQAFDWDSVSNPENAGHWSEMWIIVYPDSWAYSGQWGTSDGQKYGDLLGIGHAVTREEWDGVKNIIAQWKAAHSRVVAVIYTTDPDLFDPLDPLSLPDGTWGKWGRGTSRMATRNTTTCRYWEPN